MQIIYFVTTNQGKVNSIKRDLDGVARVEAVSIDLPEPRSDETDVIATEKALQAFEILKKPCIVQDGGFYINSLNGFPKAFVNFALETIGLEGILKLTEGKERSCEFRDTLAYIDKGIKKPLLFKSITKGSLSLSPKGKISGYNWGKLHKIFIPENFDKTFAEMSDQEISAWTENHKDDSCGAKFSRWFKKENENC